MGEYNLLLGGLRERAERAAQEGNMTATCDARYFSQAADAIEALVKRAEKAEAEANFLAKSLLRHQDDLNAAQSKLIVLRNTIVGLRNALEFVDYHISRDNTEAKEAIRIAVRSAKEAEK